MPQPAPQPRQGTQDALDFLSPQQVAKQRGEPLRALLRDTVDDGQGPACCAHGCEVEPDDHCEHGHPSLLVYLGLI